jgi:hypothetical protein
MDHNGITIDNSRFSLILKNCPSKVSINDYSHSGRTQQDLSTHELVDW